jgi:hypothetical protein
MTRSRLAAMVLSAGLGLIAGCSSDFSFRNLFNHHRANGACCSDCVGEVSGFDGPVLTPPDVPPPVAGPEVVPPPPAAPVPPLAAPPRLAPPPATPVPYSP